VGQTLVLLLLLLLLLLLPMVFNTFAPTST
jgi:hypothetical protein